MHAVWADSVADVVKGDSIRFCPWMSRNWFLFVIYETEGN